MTQSKRILGSAEVSQILSQARACAELNRWSVTIAIVDDGGHPLALQRLDDCPPLSAYIAIEKARASAMGRRESRVYEEMINGGRVAFLSAPVMGLLEGGVPVFLEGQVVGAVGVSGVSAKQDAEIAKAGASGLGAEGETLQVAGGG